MKSPKTYREELLDRLKDAEYARDYLNAAIADDDRRVFLLALRDVADAHGISRLAASSRVSREHLYRMLSKGGNPQWDTLRKVIDRIGFRLTIDIKSRNDLAA